jgi:hypothetical protein
MKRTVLVVVAAACWTLTGAAQKPANAVEQLLRAAFVAKNPKVTHAKILELRATGVGAGPYVLLGWGIRPDFKFEGVFDDELFGVFVLDNDLTKIEETLDIFPTCRWADCLVSIERVSRTDVVIAGAGSYGDVPFRKTHQLALSPPGIERAQRRDGARQDR